MSNSEQIKKKWITGQELSDLYGYSLENLGERCNDGSISCYDKHRSRIENASRLNGIPLRTMCSQLTFYPIDDSELGIFFPNPIPLTDRYYLDDGHILFINKVADSKEDVRIYRAQSNQTTCKDCPFPLNHPPCQFFCIFREPYWTIEIELSKITNILKYKNEHFVEFRIASSILDAQKLCKHTNNIKAIQQAIKEKSFKNIIHQLLRDYFDNYSILANIATRYRKTPVTSQKNEELSVTFQKIKEFEALSDSPSDSPIIKSYKELLTKLIVDKELQDQFLEFSKNYANKYYHILIKYKSNYTQVCIDDTDLLQAILDSNETFQTTFQNISPLDFFEAIGRWCKEYEVNRSEQDRITNLRNYLKEFFSSHLISIVYNLFINNLKTKETLIKVKFTKIDTHFCAEVISPDCFTGISNLTPTKTSISLFSHITANNKEEATNITYRAKHQHQYHGKIFKEDYFYFDFEMYKNIIAYTQSEKEARKNYYNYIAESFFLQEQVVDLFENGLILTQNDIENDPIDSLVKICKAIEAHQSTSPQLKKALCIYCGKLKKMSTADIYEEMSKEEYVMRKRSTENIKNNSYDPMISKYWKEAIEELRRHNLYFAPIEKKDYECKKNIVQAINNKKQFLLDYRIRIL